MGTAVRPYMVFALLAGLLLAPWAALPQARAEDDDVVELVIGEQDVEIEDFLRAIQRHTGTPMLWNPQDKNIRGKKLVGGISLSGSRMELFDLARGILATRELVMIPIGPPSHQVMYVVDARGTSAVLRLKPEYVRLSPENLDQYEGQDGRFISTSIQIEHMPDLRNARNALTRLVTGSNIGNVTEVPAARSLIVTDFAPNVVQIYRLIKEMDRPQAQPDEATIRTVAIDLKHAVAFEAAATLNQLFMQRAAPRNPRAAQAGPPAAEHAPRIVHDARTNRLLVNGTEPDIAQVRQAAALIDVPVPGTQTAVPPVVSVIRLEHVDAEELAGTLNDLVLGSPDLWRHGPDEIRPTIVPYENGDALLVSAGPAHMPAIQALVKSLDREDDDADDEDEDEGEDR